MIKKLLNGIKTVLAVILVILVALAVLGCIF
jgi:hypothetical protein